MATNEVFREARQIPVVVGASVAARTPVSVGGINGITLTATGSSGTTTATVLTEGVVDVNVHSDNGGSVVTAVGDLIYYTGTDTPVLNRKTTGKVWGVALEGLGSGVEGVIRVRIIGSPGNPQGANVGSASATTPTLIQDTVNGILTSLKAAGLMAPDA